MFSVKDRTKKCLTFYRIIFAEFVRKFNSREKLSDEAFLSLIVHFFFVEGKKIFCRGSTLSKKKT